jgi:hypothetical protein
MFLGEGNAHRAVTMSQPKHYHNNYLFHSLMAEGQWLANTFDNHKRSIV